MPADPVRRKLSPAEYVEWLSTYLTIIEELTDYAEKNGASGVDSMAPFLRVAEHTFNFFITQKSAYIDSVNPGVPDPPSGPELPQIIGQLKISRDKAADRLAALIESSPELRARYSEFCDNLKDPRSLGCML